MINYFIEKMTNIFNCFYNYIYYYYYKYSFSLMIKVSNWTNEAVKTLELIIMIMIIYLWTKSLHTTHHNWMLTKTALLYLPTWCPALSTLDNKNKKLLQYLVLKGTKIFTKYCQHPFLSHFLHYFYLDFIIYCLTKNINDSLTHVKQLSCRPTW